MKVSAENTGRIVRNVVALRSSLYIVKMSPARIGAFPEYPVLKMEGVDHLATRIIFGRRVSGGVGYVLDFPSCSRRRLSV
jgi:hypothetical protein